MSTSTYVDSETVTLADGAESSRVPVPLPNDPYVVVRQAQLVGTNIELEPEEAPSEADESQQLGPMVPLMGKEFEASEPSVRAQPAVSLGLSASVTKAMTLLDSVFCMSEGDKVGDDSEGDEVGDDSEEDEVGEGDTHPNIDSKDSKVRSTDSKGEEAAPEDQQQQAILAKGTLEGEPLRLGYRAARRQALEETAGRVHSTYEVDPEGGTLYLDIEIIPRSCALVQTSTSPEWSFGSLPVSSSSPVVPLPIASPATTLAATISVDEDQFLEVGEQLELHGSIRYYHTQRLSAVSPTLFESYDRDLKELYTRSREGENHDLRMQLVEERHERLELADRVARMKRRQSLNESSRLCGIID
nr:hypothetical protein [Tanacetum cinerariifolium]